MPRPRCLIYDLYLATLGGGERVIFEIAKSLRDDFDVVVAGPSMPERARLESFGLAEGLDLCAIPPARFPLASSGADLVVYLANGIPLPSFARRSILVLQFPMRRIGTNPVTRRLEDILLRGYDCYVYSDYVRAHVAGRWGRESTVLYPPVELGTYDPGRKRALILGVGRFFGVQHVKRHDVLIEAFRALPSHLTSDWELVLAGGIDGSSSSARYLDDLRSAAEGAAVRFEPNASRERLTELYDEATLFWHATGFGRPADHPERAEHFGMSTVEAMSHGAVPIVYADGGQTEIVTADLGVLWRTIGTLVEETTALVADPGRLRGLAEAGTIAARSYGPGRFRDRMREIVTSHRSSR